MYVLLDCFSTFTDMLDTGADWITVEPQCRLHCNWHTDA